MSIKNKPRLTPKVQRKMVLIYTGIGIALAGTVAFILFFYLNVGNQEVAYANNKTFTTIASGSWNSESTWQSGAIPPISGLNKDAVIINNDIVYDGIVSVDNQVSIAIKEGASLTLTGDLVINNNLTMLIDGDLIINGNIIAQNGAEVKVSGGGTAAVTENVTFNNNTALVVDGLLEISGSLTFGNNSNFYGDGFAMLGISGCSNWTGAPGNCEENITLPIELLNFSVKRSGREVIIKWQTSVEINNDYFNIERSHNGKDFEQIARIDGSGTSHEVLSYEYVDRYPLDGMSYYRLRQTDYDGTTEAFKIYSVEAMSLREQTVKIYPNPLYGSTFKVFFDQPEAGNIVVLSERGQMVFSQEISSGDKEQVMSFPENLKRGIYIVNITTASMQKSFKLSKM